MSSLTSLNSLLRKAGQSILGKDCYTGLWNGTLYPATVTIRGCLDNNQTVLSYDDLYRRLGGIRGAKKKAGGSSTNGRNSAGRRLGIKVWPNQFAKAGNIIVRQRGNLFRAGANVGVGKDHTLFATAAGMVSLTRLESNKKRNVVHVLPPSTPMQFNRLKNIGIDPVTLEAVAKE